MKSCRNIAELRQEIAKYQPYDEQERLNQEVILNFISKHENFLTRDNRIAHLTVSAWITNQAKTKVLMIYHNIYRSWAWVGGHADGDCDLLRVIKKEIAEETGLTDVKTLVDDLFGLDIAAVGSHIKRGQIVNTHLHFDAVYLFEANEKSALRSKPDENSDVRWIDVNEIDQYVTEEEMKPVYARLVQKMLAIN